MSIETILAMLAATLLTTNAVAEAGDSCDFAPTGKMRFFGPQPEQQCFRDLETGEQAVPVTRAGFPPWTWFTPNPRLDRIPSYRPWPKTQLMSLIRS